MHLQELQPLLCVLAGLLYPTEHDWARRRKASRGGIREAECVCRCFEVAMLLVMLYGSTFPRMAPRTRQVERPDEGALVNRWVERAIKADSKQQALSNLFRAVRTKAGPRAPPQNMV